MRISETCVLDPYFYGPSGFESGSVTHKYGSGCGCGCGSGSFPFPIKVLSGLNHQTYFYNFEAFQFFIDLKMWKNRLFCILNRHWRFWYRFASGSVCQRYRTDPRIKNVTDPEHWVKLPLEGPLNKKVFVWPDVLWIEVLCEDRHKLGYAGVHVHKTRLKNSKTIVGKWKTKPKRQGMVSRDEYFLFPVLMLKN